MSKDSHSKIYGFISQRKEIIISCAGSAVTTFYLASTWHTICTICIHLTKNGI